MRVRDETQKIVQVEGEIIGVGMEKKAIAQILSMATLKTSMLRLTLIRHAVIMGCSTLPRYLTVYQASWHARPPLAFSFARLRSPPATRPLLKHNQRGRLPRAFTASHNFSHEHCHGLAADARQSESSKTSVPSDLCIPSDGRRRKAVHPGSAGERVLSTPTSSEYTSTALPGCSPEPKESSQHTCLQTRHKGAGAWVCNLCALC